MKLVILLTLKENGSSVLQTLLHQCKQSGHCNRWLHTLALLLGACSLPLLRKFCFLFTCDHILLELLATLPIDSVGLRSFQKTCRSLDEMNTKEGAIQMQDEARKEILGVQTEK